MSHQLAGTQAQCYTVLIYYITHQGVCLLKNETYHHKLPHLNTLNNHKRKYTLTLQKQTYSSTTKAIWPIS